MGIKEQIEADEAGKLCVKCRYYGVDGCFSPSQVPNLVTGERWSRCDYQRYAETDEGLRCGESGLWWAPIVPE